ncbi:DUF4038 domain-containing protein [bacterium]|nr:DUF4038 domain-containing protein [bacterium]
MISVHNHGVLDLTLQSERTHEHPDSGCVVEAAFTSPGGRRVAVHAFWDGGRTWRIRFSPDEVGLWRWSTRCLAGGDRGLERADEEFICTKYRGSNPLYQHGPLTLSADRRTLVHTDGARFFWLGDTAWNGVIRGGDDDWREYLETRARQRFTVIQYVSSNWRGDALDDFGEASYVEGTPLRINPAYFQRLDKRVAMVNEHGLVAAPVALWSLLKTDPGYKLSEEDATRVASYIVSRYDAYQVVWLLGGDGNYQEIGVDRWKRMGRAVFSVGHDRLVTLHPCGQNWIGAVFDDEDWYDIVGYQSGHGDGEDHLRWLVKGPPAAAWRSERPRPVINLEPNYETAHGYQHKTEFTAYHVRRAAYWSMLVSPTAGLTYGHDAIWNWNATTGPSEGHSGWHRDAVPPWRTGLDTPGIRCMTVMRGIFERLDWATLKPCQEILAEQPGDANVSTFVAVGRTADGTTVIYTPCGGIMRFKPDAGLQPPVRLIDPETGDEVRELDVSDHAIETPAGRDWLVVCGKRWR